MAESLDQVAGAIGALSVLAVLAGYTLLRQQRRFDARLRTFVGAEGSVAQGRADAKQPHTGPARLARDLVPLGIRRVRLAQAGVATTPGRFTLYVIASGVCGIAVARVIAGLTRLDGPVLMAALAVGLACGLLVPLLILRLRRQRRIRKFEGQFANALDSLANAMEVGLSLAQGFEVLARNMPAPLGAEFGQVVREMALGLSVAEVLDGLAARVPLRDVEIFVAAVHIQYRTGGSLSQVLRTIANTVRERVNLRGEIRSMTAQQRFSAYLVAGLPVFLALVIRFLSPAYFERLLEPGLMRFLVVGAVAGVIAGFYFMMRIVEIEV